MHNIILLANCTQNRLLLAFREESYILTPYIPVTKINFQFQTENIPRN